MRAVIRNRRALEGVHSASALERVGSQWFLIGDDAYDLYRFTDDFILAGKIRLFEPVTGGDPSHAAKAVKLDLEAMAYLEWKGRKELLLFGSGSKKTLRDQCFRIEVSNPQEQKIIDTVSLTPLYDTLRSNKLFVGDQKLNLEAATTVVSELLLFQRGNIGGVNGIVSYPISAFMDFLDSKGDPKLLPPGSVTSVTLPKIQDRFAGFSAAVTLPPLAPGHPATLLVAASVEDTPDEIQDGPTLGSFVGLLTKEKGTWEVVGLVPVTTPDGEIAPVKIEGISLVEAPLGPNGITKVVAVTDSDGGPSELLDIDLGRF